MFLYLVSLFLISTYNYSLGVPLQNNVLEERLSALANSCGNTFISSQIQAKLTECNVLTMHLNDKQIQCLLFYDINQQLCKAIAAAKLGLPNDYSGAINEAIDVEDTCKLASDWNFTDLADFPIYRKKASQVFHLNIGCLKVCGVPEVTSQDTNFFCKYFKWGLDTLNSTMRVQDISKISLNYVNATLTQKVSTEHVNSLVNPEETTNFNVTVSSGPAALRSNLTSKPINEVSSSGNAQLVQTKTDLSTSNNKASSLVKQSNDVEVKVSPTKKPLETPSEVSDINAFDKPSAAGIEKPNKEDEPNDEFENALSSAPKETSSKKLKPVDQPEPDYNDSEEGKDGLVDGDDNGDDPGIVREVETKPEITPPENTKGVETSMSFVGEREFYPMQEQFVDDEDHFFPFFLTGIILVVLLYILYHNKSKVSKVVLGLIVEGRQPGRRRNSRGHAYRRLDTLEQAMSTNSAAPPSKIIY